ncbi:MAG: 2Fe-2S iron-sulfur cluster-binding protein, partial [Chloroflexota bacterium]
MTVASAVHRLHLYSNRTVELTVDGQDVSVPEGSTIMDACTKVGIDTPTLCYGETLEPANACRVCVVELEGSRALVPACARKAEPGMIIHTDSERVRHSRKLVMELLASSVDLSYAPDEVQGYLERYDAEPERFGPNLPLEQSPDRDEAQAGHHHPPVNGYAEAVAQPPKIDNDLYIR